MSGNPMSGLGVGNTQPESERLAILYVSQKLLLTLVFNPRLDSESRTVKAHSVDGVPEDVKVRSIFYNVQRQAFGFVIESDEFDEVGECQQIPEIYASVTTTVLRVLTDTPDAGDPCPY